MSRLGYRLAVRAHAGVRGVKRWCRHSATIAWARFVMLVAIALDVFLQAPGVNEQVVSILDPKYVPYYLLVVAVLTEIARRRTLKD